MAVKFNSQQLLMHAVWKKARADGYWSYTFDTEGKAKKFRLSLYNAVKAIRDGAVVDEEVLSAVVECIVRTDGGMVIVELRTNDEDLKAIAQNLGVDFATGGPVDALDSEVLESMRRLQAMIAEGKLDKPEPRSTPYYTREEAQ